MNKHSLWAWVVSTSIVLIGWIGLAIYFNKWWVALFCILFLPSFSKTKTHMICDGCGRYSPYAEDHRAAIEKEIKAGWVRRYVNGKWEDYCPECQAKGLGVDDV